MAKRRAVMQRDKYTCAGCGLIRMDHEVDHVVPLEQGGSNDLENLQLLCAWFDVNGVKQGCHAAKSKAEAAERAGKRQG